VSPGTSFSPPFKFCTQSFEEEAGYRRGSFAVWVRGMAMVVLFCAGLTPCSLYGPCLFSALSQVLAGLELLSYFRFFFFPLFSLATLTAFFPLTRLLTRPTCPDVFPLKKPVRGRPTVSPGCPVLFEFRHSFFLDSKWGLSWARGPGSSPFSGIVPPQVALCPVVLSTFSPLPLFPWLSAFPRVLAWARPTHGKAAVCYKMFHPASVSFPFFVPALPFSLFPGFRPLFNWFFFQHRCFSSSLLFWMPFPVFSFFFLPLPRGSVRYILPEGWGASWGGFRGGCPFLPPSFPVIRLSFPPYPLDPIPYIPPLLSFDLFVLFPLSLFPFSAFPSLSLRYLSSFGRFPSSPLFICPLTSP